MSHNLQTDGADDKLAQPLYTPIKRRSFFMYAGATAGATALVLAGCKDDDKPTPDPNANRVNVGTGDFGVLNYAYALEQLEAAFYTRVRTGNYYMMTATAAEKQVLDDLYYHEVIHRDFLKAAITANMGTPIKDLEVEFSAIDFNSKASVLGTAKTFEDLGVAAYNGAGKFLNNATFLVIAGKIVSVEARHAAVIRDLLAEGTFVDSDVVNIATNGLEKSMEPSAVVTAANNFLKEGSKLNVSNIKL
jgi:hypothetical protein